MGDLDRGSPDLCVCGLDGRRQGLHAVDALCGVAEARLQGQVTSGPLFFHVCVLKGCGKQQRWQQLHCCHMQLLMDHGNNELLGGNCSCPGPDPNPGPDLPCLGDPVLAMFLEKSLLKRSPPPRETLPPADPEQESRQHI